MSKEFDGILTQDEKSTLTFYILSSMRYREGELGAWERLAQETEDDGSLRFPNAAANAAFYRNLEEELQAISKKLGGY